MQQNPPALPAVSNNVTDHLAGYILCTGDVPPSRVCFSQFLSGRVLFSAQQSGKGTFFTVSGWERCCFRVVISFWKGWEIFVWEGQRYATYRLHTPIHKLVKSFPPRGGPVIRRYLSEVGWVRYQTINLHLPVPPPWLFVLPPLSSCRTNTATSDMTRRRVVGRRKELLGRRDQEILAFPFNTTTPCPTAVLYQGSG